MKIVFSEDDLLAACIAHARKSGSEVTDPPKTQLVFVFSEDDLLVACIAHARVSDPPKTQLVFVFSEDDLRVACIAHARQSGFEVPDPPKTQLVFDKETEGLYDERVTTPVGVTLFITK